MATALLPRGRERWKEPHGARLSAPTSPSTESWAGNPQCPASMACIPSVPALWEQSQDMPLSNLGCAHWSPSSWQPCGDGPEVALNVALLLLAWAWLLDDAVVQMLSPPGSECSETC